MTLFDGVSARIIETPGLNVNILERDGDDPTTPPERTVVLIHGNVSSSLFWQEVMRDLPGDLRVIAIDLRGFGGTEHAPVDATRGVRDFSDDVWATLEAIGIPTAHLVGWSMGGGVVMQYALDHPVLSLTLLSPVSPYGFGGTRRDGTRLTDDDAGTGAGSANPDFVQRLIDHDTTADAPDLAAKCLPLELRRGRIHERARGRLGRVDAHDLDGDRQLSRRQRARARTGQASRPARSACSTRMAPQYFNVSGIVDLDPKPPIAWIHGALDPIVSDTSFYDYNHLGQLGIIPDWPGADVAPPQEMVSQTRDVLDAYAAAGGEVTEVAARGHRALRAPRGAGRSSATLFCRSSATWARRQILSPPTETIILKSED